MAEIERKRVTLHPLNPDGSTNLDVNLYPKTFVDGIVDRDGNLVDIATQEELNQKQDKLIAGANITIEDNVISTSGGGGTDTYTREEIDAKLDTKQATLNSGTNIKTINGISVLGAGDLEVNTGVYVEANPQMTGTEGKLTGIQINDVNGNVHKYNTDLVTGVVAEAYDATAAYTTGDLVMHEALLYKCNGDTTGAWDENKWDHTTMAAALFGALDDVESALTEIDSGSGV